MKAYVIDSERAALGLRLCIGADLACVRHRTHDRRATGLWEIVASLPADLAKRFGIKKLCVSQPAVVDDYGTLVEVGEPQ